MKLKRNPGRPPRIDWKQWDDVLGTAYDRELAAKIGCEILQVIRRRKLLKIPSFRSTLVA